MALGFCLSWLVFLFVWLLLFLFDEIYNCIMDFFTIPSNTLIVRFIWLSSTFSSRTLCKSVVWSVSNLSLYVWLCSLFPFLGGCFNLHQPESGWSFKLRCLLTSQMDKIFLFPHVPRVRSLRRTFIFIVIFLFSLFISKCFMVIAYDLHKDL